MNLIMSIFLGIVQGVAEFLPISSSGHLSILQNLLSMDYSEEKHLLFDMLLHLGTLVSICAVYRTEIKTMISDGLEFLRMRNDSDSGEPVTLKPPARALLFVLVGTIPMFVAVFFMGYISRLFFSTAFIGFALIITGAILFVSDRYIQVGSKTEKTMTIKDAVIIGLAQAVAIIPGLSRSGTTIAVGLARGLNKNYAVRFSLLLSIPAVFGGTIASLFKAIREGSDFSLFPIYLAGFVIAAVVGFFAIQFIRRLMAKDGIGKFSYYCWGVGALTLILSLVLK
jgi:undecaprenyl-diphosphatase